MNFTKLNAAKAMNVSPSTFSPKYKPKDTKARDAKLISGWLTIEGVTLNDLQLYSLYHFDTKIKRNDLAEAINTTTTRPFIVLKKYREDTSEKALKHKARVKFRTLGAAAVFLGAEVNDKTKVQELINFKLDTLGLYLNDEIDYLAILTEKKKEINNEKRREINNLNNLNKKIDALKASGEENDELKSMLKERKNLENKIKKIVDNIVMYSKEYMQVKRIRKYAEKLNGNDEI